MFFQREVAKLKLKRITRAILISSAAIAAQFLSHAVFSLTPFSDYGRMRVGINIYSEASWIDVNAVDSTPSKLEIDFTNSAGNQTHIATFAQDGSNVPMLVSVFKDVINQHQMLLLIVKWHYYLPGVDTEGDFYEVHAYRVERAPHGTFHFIENSTLSRRLGSGFDGRQEGRLVRFRYKTAKAIREELRRIESQHGAEKDKEVDGQRHR
jgi:hypothetical protein